jgi:predicted RNase H-like HicB family nuclease
MDLHASVHQEEKWYVAKCIEVPVASQGLSEEEALRNLTEALELYFEDQPSGVPPPVPHRIREIHLSLR